MKNLDTIKGKKLVAKKVEEGEDDPVPIIPPTTNTTTQI